MKRILHFLALLYLLPGAPLAQEHARPSTLPAAEAAMQPAFGEKLHVNGIHNAGKISEFLYRGAQPKEQGLAGLKKLGITTIVDLRGKDGGKVAWERQQAESLGLRFVHIPVSGWSPPTDEQVVQFLSLFRETKQNDTKQKVFVHCRFGDDRTGVFVATYRMAFDHWTPAQATQEMYYFGFNGFWHPSMKVYVRDFPAHMGSAPALAPLVPQAAQR